MTATVRQRFRSAEEYADLFLTYYGPTYSAANRLDENGRAAFRADLVALARRPSTRTRTGHRRGRRVRLGVPHRHRHQALTPHHTNPQPSKGTRS